MSESLQLISDGDGVLIIGAPDDVDGFLESEGLVATSISLSKLKNSLDNGVDLVQAASDLKERTARWVKRTADTVDALQRLGVLEKDASGLTQAFLTKSPTMMKWVEKVGGPNVLANNSAVLSGPAAVMAQVALEQLVAEITDYLAVIDRKLDSVRRAQTDQVLAKLDGVDLAVKEAAAVRESVGRVSEVTWSKLHGASSTILEVQGYAVRQLAGLADQLDAAGSVNDLADLAKDAESEVQKWLWVLGTCVRLYDSVAVIELDRVMELAPAEVEAHLLGLRAARSQRLTIFRTATEGLLGRIAKAVERANSKVLFNPLKSPAVIASGNRVGASIHDFRLVLSIESEHQSTEARRWVDAASEQLDSLREGTSSGLDAVRSASTDARRHAATAKNKLADKFAKRKAGGTDDVPADGGG